MTIKTKTKKKQPYVPIVIATHDQEDETSEWEGFKLNETYELRYKMVNTGRELLLGRFTGWKMMKDTTALLNYAMSDFKDEVEEFGAKYFVRKECQRLITLYTTARLDKSRFAEETKGQGQTEIVQLVKQALKNNHKGKTAMSFLVMNICAYFCLLAEMEREDYSTSFSQITIMDCFGESLGNQMKDLWKGNESSRDRIMSFNGFKTEKELNDSIRKEGVLSFEYKECA